jgi:coproporphyrinogen III oxidase-like Fe-S oxidoreductase
MQVVEDGSKQFKEKISVTKKEAMFECVMVGLRMMDGLENRNFEELFGVPLREVRLLLLSSVLIQ